MEAAAKRALIAAQATEQRATKAGEVAALRAQEVINKHAAKEAKRDAKRALKHAQSTPPSPPSSIPIPTLSLNPSSVVEDTSTSQPAGPAKNMPIPDHIIQGVRKLADNNPGRVVTYMGGLVAYQAK